MEYVINGMVVCALRDTVSHFLFEVGFVDTLGNAEVGAVA